MAAMAALEERFESVFETLVPINGLSLQRKQQLLASADILEFGQREFVFREGDRDNFAFFLLAGHLELLAQDQLVKRIEGGTQDGAYALAQLQPRQLSARAKTSVSVLRLDRTLLDKLLTIDGADEIDKLQVSEIDAEDDGDWMTRMLQSELFSRVPAANIQRIFTKLESITVGPGDVIVEQDGPGDYYYIVQHGRCEVTRKTSTGKVPIKLAELGPGDSFGEEALVSDSLRNATVKMMTEGSLMRLVKEDFIELIKTPLLSAVDIIEGRRLVADDEAQWIDVRFPEEHANGAIEGSLNQSLNTLRMHAERLDRERTYIVYCDTGSRSSVAAFLLSERGFDVYCLDGGLRGCGILSATDQIYSNDLGLNANTDNPPSALVEDGDSPAITVAALVPASHRSEMEHSVETKARMYDADGIVDADVKAQALKAELAKANIKLEEARRFKEQAEQAKQDAEVAASETLETERVRLAEAAQLAKAQVEEAQKLKEELAGAKQQAQAEAAALATQRAEEIEQANRQIAEAQALKKELAKTKEQAQIDAAASAEKRAAEIEEANRQVLEARRLKKELAEAKRATAEQVKHLKEKEKADLEEANRQLEEARALKKEAETAKREMDREAAEQKKIAQEKERTELEEVNRQLEEARRLKQEAEAAKIEMDREAAEQKKIAQEEERAELEEANRQLKEARRLKQEAEEERLAIDREAAERLRVEQEKLAQDARRAQSVMEEAQRIKEEVTREKELAEQDAERARREQQEQFDQMRVDAEARMREEEKKLAESYAWQAEELARLQKMKDEAESELEKERARLKDEAAEAKTRLREAQRIQNEVEKTRLDSTKEAEHRQRRQIELERKLRDEAQEQLASERHKIEAEFARNAEELERARREKEAAEAARIAAAEEAERIIAEYKETHEKLREREEEKLRAERARLQSEAEELRGALDQSRIEQQRALELQRAAEAQIQALAQEKSTGAAEAAQLADDIAALEEEAREAHVKAQAAEEAQRKAQAAANANREFMEKNVNQEQESRGRFEDEIANWVAEQDAVESSDVQQQILANQRAHLERIKARAQSAREAAKHHDQSLIDELASHLKEDESS